MLYFCNEWKLLIKWDPDINSYIALNIDRFEILSIGALLCSSDVISTIQQVSFEIQPNLYSVIYGESVFNDIVSILLINVIHRARIEYITE